MKTNNQIEVIVFRKDKKDKILFLVLKRVPQKGGFWQPITGNVQEGESFEAAAIRELQEETGINEVLELIDSEYAFCFFDDKRNQFERVFGARVRENEKVILSKEHGTFKWVTKEVALDKYLKYPGNKEGLRRLCEKIER